jgi:hypothetical protein
MYFAKTPGTLKVSGMFGQQWLTRRAKKQFWPLKNNTLMPISRHHSNIKEPRQWIRRFLQLNSNTSACSLIGRMMPIIARY